MTHVVFSFLTVIVLTAGIARADTYYVNQTNPLANDNNPGTEIAPFKTIERAVQVIRGGDHVVVGPGRYVERIELDFRHSGTPEMPTIWSAFPAVAATIDGLRVHSNHVAIEDFAVVSRIKSRDLRGTGIDVRGVKILNDPQRIRDVVTVLGEATDNVGVVAVRFLLNGLLLHPGDYEEPFSATWDTNIASDDVYALTGIAADAAGNESADTILVEIQNDCRRRCK